MFNKMLIMLPVMLLARRLDGEDPTVVYWLRIAYGVVQVISVAVVGYVYLKAAAAAQAKEIADVIIYVPPPAVPFADPNAKKKYTEIAYGAHIVSTARSLLSSTLFGILLTVGLHYYKGMVMGLAIQAIMAPFNLAESPLVKAIFLGSGAIRPQDKIFDEKSANELSAEDEIVDGQGNPVARGAAGGAISNSSSGQTLEEVMLDTWDAGNKADIGPLMKMLTKDNCNFQTKEDNWTPLMILAGLGANGTASAIRQVKELGADPAVVDKEGWTALHWAAFHGSFPAANALSSETAVLQIKDKEGHTPIDTARKEGNETVAEVFERALGDTKKTK